MIDDHLFPFGESFGDRLVGPRIDDGSSSALVKVIASGSNSCPIFGTEEDTLYVSTIYRITVVYM